MFEFSRTGRLHWRLLSASLAVSLMSCLAYAVPSGSNTLIWRPMEHFAALNLQTCGAPAIALLFAVYLWNRCLATILEAPKDVRLARQTPGLLSALEADPGPYAVCFGTGFLWISILHAALNDPEFWWLDLGAYAWPLTWAAVCGPWFVQKYWTRERSSGSVVKRILLLIIALMGVAGWVYQLLPLAGL